VAAGAREGRYGALNRAESVGRLGAVQLNRARVEVAWACMRGTRRRRPAVPMVDCSAGPRWALAAGQGRTEVGRAFGLGPNQKDGFF
jgi:hypothetical protein